MTDFVYQSLMSMSEKGFDVFLRKDIPQRWHYQKHRRIAPLLLVAKEGVAVLTEESKRWVDGKADHGYDNDLDSMRPVFLARGPGFRQATPVTDTIGLENIFALCAHLLGIDAGTSNGTATVFQSVLTREVGNNSSAPQSTTFIIVCMAFISWLHGVTFYNSQLA